MTTHAREKRARQDTAKIAVAWYQAGRPGHGPGYQVHTWHHLNGGEEKGGQRGVINECVAVKKIQRERCQPSRGRLLGGASNLCCEKRERERDQHINQENNAEDETTLTFEATSGVQNANN